VHRTWGRPWGVRRGHWVYIDAPTGAVSKEPDWLDYEPNPHGTCLFNLRDDLGQRDNLVAKHPEKAAELAALLKEIRERGYSAPRLTVRDR